jgi:hypothetical protein
VGISSWSIVNGSPRTCIRAARIVFAMSSHLDVHGRHVRVPAGGGSLRGSGPGRDVVKGRVLSIDHEKAHDLECYR